MTERDQARLEKVKAHIAERFTKTVVGPLGDLVDQNVSDIVTTVGAFVIRKVRGKFQRSISFTIGNSYSDRWMETALYGILYQWNDIKASPRLELTNEHGIKDGSGMYYRLDDGTHSLKYRDFNILLVISTNNQQITPGRSIATRIYTIITYNLSQDFVKLFERDMVAHRNSLLQIKKDSPLINIYKDYHESDGYTYWEKSGTTHKRPIGTVYLPYDKMKQLVNTINEFFSNKNYYYSHGITHNLKILLYGPPGTGKDTISKMIASEWNRNLYYIQGGKDGKFVPESITDNEPDQVNYPLMLISDIDKYPMFITEPEEVKTDDDSAKAEKMAWKQGFGRMINALDGILSGEDRIIIMTTNHIEKFSETFLRPGRIDLCLEIGYVEEDVFRKWVFDNYHKEVPANFKLGRNNITVSEMQTDYLHLKMTFDEFIEKYKYKEDEEKKEKKAK